jgi:hypothetical protein
MTHERTAEYQTTGMLSTRLIFEIPRNGNHTGNTAQENGSDRFHKDHD